MADSHGPEPVPRIRSGIFAALFVVAQLGWSTVAYGESGHDLLLFTSIEGFELFDSSDPAQEEFDPRYTGDVLYTYSSDRFRLLGEFVISNHETELERLQAALRIDDRTFIWAGRFHSVSKFWTSEFHHGQFLQTSISRPKLEEWEDERGPMPSHVTGALFERKFERPDLSEISFSLAAGLGPKFVDTQLVPFDILEPESGHKGAWNVNLTFRPDVLASTQFGLMASWSDIAVDSVFNPAIADLAAVHQQTAGLFADWHGADLRLMAYGVWFDNQLRYVDRHQMDRFFLGYVQGEYAAADDWTVFGRAEFGPDQGSSAYLDLLPGFIPDRDMLGVRWDIHDNHSLTLELAQTGGRSSGAAGTEYKEVRLQWSAVFP